MKMTVFLTGFLSILMVLMLFVGCSTRDPVSPVPVEYELDIQCNVFAVENGDTLFKRYNVRDNIPDHKILSQIWGESNEGIFETVFLDEYGKPTEVYYEVDSIGRNHYYVYWGRYSRPFRFYGK